MATRFAGAYKVAVVNPVPVGTGLTDFGANITLIPDVSVDTQNNNSYIDPSAGSPIDDLATAMAAELASDTDKLAGSLKSEMQQVGTETMSKADYLAYVHRNWADPRFRTSLLKQIGNKPFLDLAQDVVAAHGHPALPPPLALGGMIQAPTVNSGMVPPMSQAMPTRGELGG